MAKDLFGTMMGRALQRQAPQGHMTAFITQGEADVLRSLGGGVSPNGGQIMRNGIPSFQRYKGMDDAVLDYVIPSQYQEAAVSDPKNLFNFRNEIEPEKVNRFIENERAIAQEAQELQQAEVNNQSASNPPEVTVTDPTITGLPEAEELSDSYMPVTIEGGRDPRTLSLGNVVHSATRDPIFTNFEEYEYPTLDGGLGSWAARIAAGAAFPIPVPGLAQGFYNFGTNLFTEEGRQHQANRSAAGDSAREIMAWAGNDPAKMALANAEIEKLSLQYPGLMPGENRSYSHSQLSALSGMRPHEQIIATRGDQVDPDGNVYSGGQSPWDIANENEQIMMAEILAGQQRDQAPPSDGDVDGSVSDEEQLHIDRVLENIAQLPEGYADRLGLINRPTIPIQPQPPYSGNPRISPETPAPIPAPAGFQKPATYINPGAYPDIFVNDMTGERFKAPSLGYVPPPGWRRVSESSQNLRPPNRLQPDKFGRTLLW